MADSQEPAQTATPVTQKGQEAVKQEVQKSDAPTLELRKNNKRLARLTQVKLKAAQRTNRRIQMINDDLAEQKAGN